MLSSQAAARLLLAVLAAAVLLSEIGCVHTYQPMSGLHDPVIVDIQAPNFTDVNLTIHCIPGVDLSPQEASVLCENVGVLFRNQGAKVRTVTTSRALQDDALGGELGESAAEEDAEAPTDLLLELRGRRLNESNDPLLWALCYASLTMVPAVSEFTFAQDAVVRDGSGFLLSTDTVQGRIVRQFGGSVWLGNRILDRLVREERDEVTGDAAKNDLSEDLYRQLSQMVYNAKVQWQVLQAASPPDAVEESSWR